MRPPEAVVFDLGKVLVDFDYSIAARKLAALGHVMPEAVQRFIDHSPLLFRYETGKMRKEDIFKEVAAATGFSGGLAAFEDAFADIFTAMPEMIALHAEIRSRKIPTYIFSNTNDIAVTHIRRTFPFFNNFDGYILSYEHGAMKPDAKLYEVVERTTGLSGAAILYLDDRKENVEAGAARGWRVILQRSHEETRREIEAYGLLA
jgi:putative hydrolase of the HAD superfamily